MKWVMLFLFGSLLTTMAQPSLNNPSAGGFNRTPPVAAGGSSYALVEIVTNKTTAVATSLTWTFTAATAGDLLVVCAGSDGAAPTLTAGWTIAARAVADFQTVTGYKTAAGGETSVTYTLGTSEPITGIFMRFTGMSATPLDKTSTNSTSGGSSTISLGTTATTSQADELCIGVCVFSTQAVSGWSNSFTDVNGDATYTTGSSPNLGVGVCLRKVTSTGTYTTTATMTDVVNALMSGNITTFKITNP